MVSFPVKNFVLREVKFSGKNVLKLLKFFRKSVINSKGKEICKYTRIAVGLSLKATVG